ncbi:MAG: S8 family serine peptidase [Candidatus Magasanikbacteria bacterium]
MKKCLLKFTFLFFSFLLFAAPTYARKSNDPEVDQWAFEDIGVYDAWNKATGSREVIVAIIDNGFDTYHPDLRENVWKNVDEIADNDIDDDNNGYIDDVWGWNFAYEDKNGNGGIDEEEEFGNNNPRPEVDELTDEDVEYEIFNHGTAVAGIIGGIGNNMRAGAGINWKVRLMNIKVVDNSGVGRFLSLEPAVRYAVDNGADIINISMVGEDTGNMEEIIDYAYDHGVAVIAAAGNNLRDMNRLPVFPICADRNYPIEKILGVSAVDQEHRIATFSNYGSDCIDITAPGVGISSTLRYSPTNGLSIDYGGELDGTSFAAPMVSGAAALIKSIRPSWGAVEIYDTLLSTAHHTPGQDEYVYKNLFGAGLLQIDKAIEYALSQPETATKKATFTQNPSFITFEPSTGRAIEYNLLSKETDGNTKAGLKDIDSVAAFEKGSRRYYVTSKHSPERRMSAITIYTADWGFVHSWEIQSAGSMEVQTGNVLGDEKEEIIISPSHANDKLFLVYSQSGVLLETHSVDFEHSGVSLAIKKQLPYDEIVTLVLDEGRLLLQSHTSSAVLTFEKIIEGIQPNGSLGVADIDGDGYHEYIVGAGPGGGAYLLYINHEGRILRKFLAYSGEYQEGLDLVTLDYDEDGKDDIVVWTTDSRIPIRIWNYRSRRLLEWLPFGPTPDILYNIFTFSQTL